MESTPEPVLGRGGHLVRPPLTGPEARRVAKVCRTAVIVYEGGGTWTLCERRRKPRPAECWIRIGGDVGRLCLMEDAYTIIKRYPRLDGGEIENDVRRLVSATPETLLDEIDDHNARLAETKRRDWRRETSARFAEGHDRLGGTRRFGVDGLGRGFGGAARLAS